MVVEVAQEVITVAVLEEITAAVVVVEKMILRVRGDVAALVA
jgi:hypothetical protein